MKKTKILIPIHNDWQSVFKLLEDIDNELFNWNTDVSVLIINDASTEKKPESSSVFKNLRSIKIINMKKNKGSLIEAYVQLNEQAIASRKLLQQQEKQLEKMAVLIAEDNELSMIIMKGGIVTSYDKCLTWNKVTNQLVIKKVASSFSISSKLTDAQAEVL